MKRSTLAAACLGAACSLGALPSHANLIYFGVVNATTGVANSGLMSTDISGQQTSSTGTVVPNGSGGVTCTGDITGGCPSANNQVLTPLSAGITSASDLVIVFDAQETGQDTSVTFNSLVLRVFNPTGTTSLFTASLVPSPLPVVVTPGQGFNGVNAFLLDTAQAALLQQVWNGGSNLIGLSATLSNVSGGADRFFLANRRTGGVPDIRVPEPGTLALLGLSLAGLGALRRGRD